MRRPRHRRPAAPRPRRCSRPPPGSTRTFRARPSGRAAPPRPARPTAWRCSATSRPPARKRCATWTRARRCTGARPRPTARRGISATRWRCSGAPTPTSRSPRRPTSSTAPRNRGWARRNTCWACSTSRAAASPRTSRARPNSMPRRPAAGCAPARPATASPCCTARASNATCRRANPGCAGRHCRAIRRPPPWSATSMPAAASCRPTMPRRQCGSAAPLRPATRPPRARWGCCT